MRIGLDLDNTIIRYDSSFHSAAVELGLISPSVTASKTAVKNAVLAASGNDAWTKLQAEVYGPRLAQAETYPGAGAAVREFLQTGHEVFIISHKTRVAAIGFPHDLRAAALDGLDQWGWFDEGTIGLTRDAVEFHETRAGKVAAIARRGCEVFVDDLPEVFAEPGFPSAALRILFDPDGAHAGAEAGIRASNWQDVEKLVLSRAGGLLA